MGRSLLARLQGSARPVNRVGLSMDAQVAALVHLPMSGAARPLAAALRTLEMTPQRTLADALGQAVGELHLRNTPCTLTLSPGEYQTFQIDRPPVEPDELVAAARWRVRDLLDYPLDEAIIDVFEVPGQSQRGRAPAVMVVAARQGLLRQRLDLIEAAGLRPDRIDIAELALRNLLARLGGPDETLVTLYLANHRGLILITRGERLYVARGVDYGLDEVRDALAPAVDGNLAVAGSAEAFCERVALEVQRTLDYFERHFGLEAARRLLLAPALSGVDALATQVGSSLGLSAEVLSTDTLVGLDTASGITAPGIIALGGALRLPTGGGA